MDIFDARKKYKEEIGITTNEKINVNWPSIVQSMFKNELEEIYKMIGDAIKNKEREIIWKVDEKYAEHDVFALKRFLVEAKGFDVLLSFTRDFTEVRNLHISGWARFI